MELPKVLHHKTLLLLAAAILTTPAAADEKPSTPITAIRPGKALTADELALLFDAQVWKLHIDLPPKAVHGWVSLDLKEGGKDRQGWGISCGGQIRPDTNGEVLVAIIPVGGTLHAADKVRVVINGFGNVGSTTEDNPFKSLGIGRPGVPEDLKDGSFNLIGGYKGRTISSPVSSADKAISLRITTSEK